MIHYLLRQEEEEDERLRAVISIEIADYTGPSNTDLHNLNEVELDVQTFAFKTEDGVKRRRLIIQESEMGSELPPVRALTLPNVALKDEWNLLVFEGGLPSRLLRYLVCSGTLTSCRSLTSIPDPNGRHDEDARPQPVLIQLEPPLPLTWPPG